MDILSVTATIFIPFVLVGIDRLVQSGAGPQSTPPASVQVINSTFAVSVAANLLQVTVGSSSSIEVIVLTNPLLNH